MRRERSDAGAWALGAFGEVIMGRRLGKLPRAHWLVFHDLQRGPTERNLDHLVIGPPGVFVINTKLRNGLVKVTSSRIYVNGAQTSMLAAIRHEAREAAARLSKGSGVAVTVRPVLAILCDEYKVESQPSDVFVRLAGDFPGCLTELPARFTMAELAPIVRAVVMNSTWAREDPRLLPPRNSATRSPSNVTSKVWAKYGRNRLYITADGIDVGFFDLITKTAVPLDESFRDIIEDAGRNHQPELVPS